MSVRVAPSASHRTIRQHRWKHWVDDALGPWWDTQVLSVGNMHHQSPLCPNCSRPMIVARTIPGALGVPEVNVFECRRCSVDFITEDHLTIAGTTEP